MREFLVTGDSIVLAFDKECGLFQVDQIRENRVKHLAFFGKPLLMDFASLPVFDRKRRLFSKLLKKIFLRPMNIEGVPLGTQGASQFDKCLPNFPGSMVLRNECQTALCIDFITQGGKLPGGSLQQRASG